MFYSYRKFNQSSRKKSYLLILILIMVFILGIIFAYKGLEVKPKVITTEIDITAIK